MSIKALFCRKIYEELQIFRQAVLCQEKENIYGESYKIDIFVNLYEILAEQADKLSDDALKKLLNQSTGILAYLYDSWMKKEDSSYSELEKHVLEEVAK